MKYGKLDKDNKYDDEEEEKVFERKTKKDLEMNTTRKRVEFHGRMYDLEDGQLVDYIEVYIPVIKKTLRINACHFFQYIFGAIIITFNIWLFYTILFDDKKKK